MSAGAPPAGAGGLRWRAMTAGDLGAVATIAREVHAAHPERDDVFAERLALFAPGCLVLSRAEAALGYAIAHPWLRRDPPALDTLLGALPARPDCLYLHDVALRPVARGAGWGAVLVKRLVQLARREGLARLALVALSGTASFWRAQGFVPASPPAPAAKLAGYGGGALAMQRAINPAPRA